MLCASGSFSRKRIATKKMGNPRRETVYTFAQGKATSMADLSLLYYYRETTDLLLSFQKLHLSRVEGYCI